MLQQMYDTKAIVPPMPWLDSIAPLKPEVHVSKNTDGKWLLTMQQKSADATKFVLYKFDKNEPINISLSENIEVIINYANSVVVENNSNYKYVVTSLDRLNNESKYTKVIFP